MLQVVSGRATAADRGNMQRRKILAGMKPPLWTDRLVGAMVVTLCTSGGCAQPPPAKPPQRSVRIATGLPGMTFKSLGEALASVYGETLSDMRFSVVETEGSVDNLAHLESGDADLGLALADVAYMGYNGHIPELGKPAVNIRAIAVLHPSVVHVLVPQGSPVTSLSDLRGRRIGVGPAGSGTAVTSSMLLHAFGVAGDAVRHRTIAFSEATQALLDGDIDASFTAAAAPVAVVQRAMEAGARLIDIDGPALERLRIEYPFLRPATIPAGTYPGQPRSVQTVCVDVVLLCRANLDDVLVHRLTDQLFEVLPTLAERSSYLRLIDVRRAPTPPVPLHPGAAWYYREQELSR